MYDVALCSEHIWLYLLESVFREILFRLVRLAIVRDYNGIALFARNYYAVK